MKLARGCKITFEELCSIVDNVFSSRRSSNCVPKIHENGTRAGNQPQQVHMQV